MVQKTVGWGGRHENAACSIATTVDGRILSTSGDVRHFLNISARAVEGRDIYLFIQQDRTAVRRALIVAAPNVTLERDLVLRPMDRRPFEVRALITRESDDTTVRWEFSELPGSGLVKRR